MINEQFFKTIKQYIDIDFPETIITFLRNEYTRRLFFKQLDSSVLNNYLYQCFNLWLGRYACEYDSHLADYFSGKNNLDFICSEFIKFCFKNEIKIDAEKTLQSFVVHNQFSDNAVRNELIKITPKSHLNLLGFGLDQGCYEKELAQYLLKKGIADNVTVYGMDPYAKKSQDIYYLTPSQLAAEPKIRFDIIIARWVLHHVSLQYRWSDLIQCLNHCSSDAKILFIEHGFLQKPPSLIEEKLYLLLNAIFDIIANIGLRPCYFTENTAPLRSNFFIRYLKPNDFSEITKNLPYLNLSQNTYNVGPVFPNQTILCIASKS